MTKQTKLQLVLACSAVLAHAVPPAESMNRSILEEVIVTASRSESTIFDAPYTAHVIDSSDFRERRNVRTFSDALATTPGVMLQRTGHGQTSPFIRGFTGFRTLALIDGIRLNNAVFREGPNQYWSTIDPYTIDRIDVVKGPSSVLYGSDAIGGTVNAITKNPVLPSAAKTIRDGKQTVVQTTGGPEIHGSTEYRYASAEDSHTARGELSLGLSPNFGIIGGLSLKSYGDLRGGDVTGRQRNSGYDEIDGDLKMLWKLSDNTDLTVALYHFEQNNAPRWHSTIFSESFDGTTTGTDLRRNLDQTRDLAYAKLETRDVAPWLNKATFTLSFHRQTEEQDRIRAGGRRDIDGFQDDQYGFTVNLESPSSIGKFTYGVEYYHDEIQSWGSRWNPDGSLRNIKPRGPVADDSTYDLLGVYLQNEIKVGSRLTITPGVRWTYARMDAGIVDPDPSDALDLESFTETMDALTFSLRGKYDVSEKWNFFTGISQGFRAPNVNDYTAFDIARSGELETPTRNLDPEQYLAFEFGTKANIANQLDIYAAYYRTWIDDQIIRFPTGNTIGGDPEVQRTNSGDGYIQGVELGLSWNFAKGWNASGNLAWSEGEVGQFANGAVGVYPVSRIHPLTGQLAIRWESEDAKWWAEGSAILARHQDRLSPGDQGDTQRIPPGGTHGYAVYHLRAGWKPTENVNIFAACENITNEDYRIHGSGISEAGRNFVLGAKFAF